MSAVVPALERELRTFRSRLREATSRWYAAAAPPFASRADVAFHVVRRTAELAWQLEFPDEPVPRVPRLPDLSLADQLDVVAHDLGIVLARQADEELCAALLAELLLHRMHLDGAAPGRESLDAVAGAIGARDAAAWSTLCAARGPAA